MSERIASVTGATAAEWDSPVKTFDNARSLAGPVDQLGLRLS